MDITIVSDIINNLSNKLHNMYYEHILNTCFNIISVINTPEQFTFECTSSIYEKIVYYTLRPDNLFIFEDKSPLYVDYGLIIEEKIISTNIISSDFNCLYIDNFINILTKIDYKMKKCIEKGYIHTSTYIIIDDNENIVFPYLYDIIPYSKTELKIFYNNLLMTITDQSSIYSSYKILKKINNDNDTLVLKNYMKSILE